MFFLHSVLNANGSLIIIPLLDPTFNSGAPPSTPSVPSEVLPGWCSSDGGSPTPISSRSYSPIGSHPILPPTSPIYEKALPTPYVVAIPALRDESTFPPRHVTSCVAVTPCLRCTQKAHRPPVVPATPNTVWTLTSSHVVPATPNAVWILAGLHVGESPPPLAVASFVIESIASRTWQQPGLADCPLPQPRRTPFEPFAHWPVFHLHH